MAIIRPDDHDFNGKKNKKKLLDNNRIGETRDLKKFLLDIFKEFGEGADERIGWWTKKKLRDYVYDVIEVSKVNNPTIGGYTPPAPGPSGEPDDTQPWVAAALAAGAIHIWAPGEKYLGDYLNPSDNDWTMQMLGDGEPEYMIECPSGFNAGVKLTADTMYQITNGIKMGYSTTGGGHFDETIIEIVYKQESSDQFVHLMNQQTPSDTTGSASYQLQAVDVTTGTDHNYACYHDQAFYHDVQTTAPLDDWNQVFFNATYTSAGGPGACGKNSGTNGTWNYANIGYPVSDDGVNPIKIGYRNDQPAPTGGLILLGIAVYPNGSSPNMATVFAATGI